MTVRLAPSDLTEDWLKATAWDLPVSTLAELRAWLATDGRPAEPVMVAYWMHQPAARPMPEVLLNETLTWLDEAGVGASVPRRFRKPRAAALRARAAATVLAGFARTAYSPDQSRDSSGRFGEGGGEKLDLERERKFLQDPKNGLSTDEYHARFDAYREAVHAAEWNAVRTMDLPPGWQPSADADLAGRLGAGWIGFEHGNVEVLMNTTAANDWPIRPDVAAGAFEQLGTMADQFPDTHAQVLIDDDAWPVDDGAVGRTWSDSNVIQLRSEVLSGQELSAETFMPAMSVAQADSPAGTARYITAHEFGHAIDTGSEERPTISDFWVRRLNEGDTTEVSSYGRSGSREAHAELFAEWAMSGGTTTNPAAREYAAEQGWGA